MSEEEVAEANSASERRRELCLLKTGLPYLSSFGEKGVRKDTCKE